MERDKNKMKNNIIFYIIGFLVLSAMFFDPRKISCNTEICNGDNDCIFYQLSEGKCDLEY